MRPAKPRGAFAIQIPMTRNERKKLQWVRKWVTVGLAVLLVLAVAVFNALCPFRTLLAARAIAAPVEGELRIYFLDVGQGDCTVVSFPNGEALVIDGGDGSWKNDDHLMRFFKGLHAKELTFVSSHADTDHCGGLAYILEYFGAKTLYLPAIGSDDAAYTDMQTEAEKRGAEIKTAKRYEILDYGEAYVSFLSPYSQEETETNEASTVLYLQYGEFSALFTADINAKREEKLRQEYEAMQSIFDYKDYTVRLEDIDVLKVAHHGSDASSNAQWLALLKPKASVISCGRGNPYGHPSGGALQRLFDCGSEIYRTDELGDIMISAFPDGNFEVTWE